MNKLCSETQSIPMNIDIQIPIDDMKCYIKCVLEHLGIYNVKNKSVTEHRTKNILYLTSELRMVHATVELCPTHYDDAFDCDKAWDLYVCLYSSKSNKDSPNSPYDY